MAVACLLHAHKCITRYAMGQPHYQILNCYLVLSNICFLCTQNVVPLEICGSISFMGELLGWSCCLLGACSQTHNQIHSRSSKFNKAAKQKTSFSVHKPSSFLKCLIQNLRTMTNKNFNFHYRNFCDFVH